MIKRITHTSIYVRDIDEAHKWYTEVLGFVPKMDSNMDEIRWVTITPKEQPEFEVILQPTMWGPDGEVQEAREAQIGKQPGFILETDDIHALVNDLKAKGVEFTMEIAEQPWGTQAVFKDLYGNVHVLSQPPAGEMPS